MSADPKFWNDPAQSQKVLQRRKKLENDLDLDKKLSREIGDLQAYFELGAEGEEVNSEIRLELKRIEEELTAIETATLLSGDNAQCNPSSRFTREPEEQNLRIGPKCSYACICAGRKRTGFLLR